MKRTAEFILGLLGGIFGFIGAIMALFIGGIDAAFSSTGESEVIGLGWGAVLFSIIAIVGCILVRTKDKIGGILMLVAAVGGIICISLFYLIPAILLVIAGVMALVRKPKNKFA